MNEKAVEDLAQMINAKKTKTMVIEKTKASHR